MNRYVVFGIAAFFAVVGIAMLGGDVSSFTAPNVAMANVKAGRLKLLAVTTRDRVPSMPEVPTVHETLKDFEYLGWIIAFAPAATPRAVLDTLASTWNKARTTPALQRKLEDLAMNAPERFAQRGTLLGRQIADVERHRLHLHRATLGAGQLRLVALAE